MKRLAIIVTHPIQYYAPVFKALSMQKEIAVKVFYTWGEGSLKKYDPGFKREVEWDVPLLEGYDYVFLKNTSPSPGSSHFKGIINPDAINQIEAFDPHAVLVYGWAWHSHLKIIRSFNNKKQVWFRGDSTLLDSAPGWRTALRSLLLRCIYTYIDKAFYVGTANKAYFLKFGLKPRQLKLAPHAIDNNRFSACRREEAVSLRKTLGIPEGGILILFAGKLEPKKDPLALLEAFSAIKKESIYLLFAGNGVLEEEVKAKAAASAKRDRILFLGFQNQRQMPVLYQACDLFCLPSRGPGETWGLAVNEAMASGKAILVSDKVGCSVDLVKEGENGSIFRSGDLTDLTCKLDKLVNDPVQLLEMGKQSQSIIQNWTFDHQVSSIVEEIRAIQS